MSTSGEPEHELVRRLLPYSLPAFAVATLTGGFFSGAGAAWSGGIAVIVVTANFVGNAYSVSWGARIGPTGAGLGRSGPSA